MPELRTLRAGALTAQLDGVDLRYVRVGRLEIVRRLYVAIRNRNWVTVPAQCAGLAVTEDDAGFEVQFDARHRLDELDFSWRGRIHADASGSLVYSMDGLANTDFPYNRIGICVLHPPDSAGRPFYAETEGGQLTGELPLRIGPQLFIDGVYHALFPPFDALELQLDDGTIVFRFEGDLFEMEDQRNWADASFKTYSTPLALGFPHEAKAMSRIVQTVTVDATDVMGRAPAASPAAGGPVVITVGARLGRRLPPIGLGMSSHGQPLTSREVELLRALRLAHLRADLDLILSAEPRLELARDASRALGCRLELALYVTAASGRAFELLARELADLDIARVLVFDREAGTTKPNETTPAQLVELVRGRLARALPGVPIGGGTDFFFCELNRTRPDTSVMDVVSFTTNPTIHASDDLSLVETLEAQGETVRSALAIAHGKPVAVSPTTLRYRSNPHASQPVEQVEGELPSQVDPRQLSHFAAAWTLGSIKYTAEAGASSLTFYETTGWRGVIETETGPLLPERFPSAPGMILPLYNAFAVLAGFEGAELVGCTSSEPLSAIGLALRRDGQLRIVLANLTAEARQIEVAHRGIEVELEPYALLVVEPPT